ncbi:MAG: hypothetical protein R2855_09850 [Thermomicrobiales bacterium]
MSICRKASISIASSSMCRPEYGWVTIWKYTARRTFDYGSSDLSYYESSCTERPEGVEFDLYNQPYG